MAFIRIRALIGIAGDKLLADVLESDAREGKEISGADAIYDDAADLRANLESSPSPS